MYLLFNATLAIDFNVNTAIFLENIKSWILKNLANNRNIHDGHCWTYNTHKAFQKLFPFWTERQIETIINNAISAGLLIKGNYNKITYDQTVWYTMTDKAKTYFPEFKDPKYDFSLNLPISPKREMEIPKKGNGDPQTVTPIPIKLPNKLQDLINPSVDLKSTVNDSEKSAVISKPKKSKTKDYKDDELFMNFYNVYPNKQKPLVAHKAFLKHNFDKAAVEMIVNDIQLRMTGNWQGRDKSKIPFPATYLNGREWEGEIYSNITTQPKTQWTVEAVFNA